MAIKVYSDAVETDWDTLEKEIGKITTKQQISIKLSSDPNIELFVVVGDGGLYGYVMFDKERGQLYHFTEASTSIEALDTKTKSPDALLIRNYGGSHYYVECSKDGPSAVYKNIPVKSKQLMELEISSIWFPVEREPTTAIPFDSAKEAKKLKKIEEKLKLKQIKAMVDAFMNAASPDEFRDKVSSQLIAYTGHTPSDDPVTVMNDVFDLLHSADVAFTREIFDNKFKEMERLEREEIQRKLAATKGSAVCEDDNDDDKKVERLKELAIESDGNESDLSDGW